MTIYSAKLQLVVTADKDDLNIKTGIDCYGLPHQLKEIMSDLLVKFPVLIRFRIVAFRPSCGLTLLLRTL